MEQPSAQKQPCDSTKQQEQEQPVAQQTAAAAADLQQQEHLSIQVQPGSDHSAIVHNGNSSTSPLMRRQVTFPDGDAIAVIYHLQPSSSIGDLSNGTPCFTHSHHRHHHRHHGTLSCCGCWPRLLAAVKQLKQDILALYYAVHDPRTPLLSKLLPLLVLAYALSPLDLIPDFIPVLGYLDDLLLLPLGLWLSYKLIPAEVMQDSRARAAAEPLRLSSNWAVATLIFCLWTAGLLFTGHWLLIRYGSNELQRDEWLLLGGSGGLAVLVYVAWVVQSVMHEQRQQEQLLLQQQQQQQPPLSPSLLAQQQQEQQDSMTEPLMMSDESV